MYFLDKGDLWKREHLGNLEFGKTEIVVKDISSYDIWPDESGILTFSKGDGREAFIEFDFIERLKEIVPPTE